MTHLSQEHCTPVAEGTPALSEDLASALHKQVEGWNIEDNKLKREYKFSDFMAALAFVNAIGKIAEDEDHHPDILLTYGKVGVTLWTHTVGGLSRNDFILAAKFDSVHE